MQIRHLSQTKLFSYCFVLPVYQYSWRLQVASCNDSLSCLSHLQPIMHVSAWSSTGGSTVVSMHKKDVSKVTAVTYNVSVLAFSLAGLPTPHEKFLEVGDGAQTWYFCAKKKQSPHLWRRHRQWQFTHFQQPWATTSSNQLKNTIGRWSHAK